MSLTILGTGSAMPEKRLTNEELTHMVDTSDEWIVTRTGIHERRIITTETLSGLGARALALALEDAGCAPEELELILCTTVRGDTATPALANMIEQELRIECPAMDINGACAGFIAALDVAAAYLASGRVKRMAIVSAEALSFLTDWTDRSTCVLFGDGAGAV
ncbi:MAG: 3-oxoacyl-ACP synthase, partial [Christensenellaceae bacterium]